MSRTGHCIPIAAEPSTSATNAAETPNVHRADIQHRSDNARAADEQRAVERWAELGRAHMLRSLKQEPDRSRWPMSTSTDDKNRPTDERSSNARQQQACTDERKNVSTPYGQQYPPQDGQSGEQGTEQQSSRNNPMAVTSMVLSLVGIVTSCLGLGSLLGILGVIFGHVGLSRIKRDGSQGRGMALAGVIIGYVLIALNIVLGIIFLSTGAMQFHSM